MKIPRLTSTAISVAGILCLASSINAQVTINATGTYTQDFNSLAASGTNHAWTNNATVPGWYLQRAIGAVDYDASTGSLTAGSVYSYGIAAASDRALGSLGTTGTGSVAWGIVFQNTSLSTLTFTDFSYTGELWRRGATGKIDTLEFDYRMGPAAATDLLVATGWTAVNALDFTNPNTAGGASALDGNNAANRMMRSTLLDLALAPGQFVTFRWLDIDHPGTDNGLAIDDLSIAYVSSAPQVVIAAVPEPSTYGLAAVAGLGALIALHRRKHRTQPSRL